MTIYTKNGKPILKNVGGVYKLVTGDCCCEDGPCGLPHLVIQLGNAHATGGREIAAGGTVMLSMIYYPVANGQSIENRQTITKQSFDPPKWDEYWTIDPPAVSWALCADGATEKTNRLHWGDPNDIDVYPPADASVAVPAQIAFGLSYTGATGDSTVAVTVDATIVRSFRCKVLDRMTLTNNGQPTERTSQNNSTFQISLPFSLQGQQRLTYVIDIVRK